MNPTIRDVARKAKVSTATVSRVLNSSGAVDESTRRRVDGLIVMSPDIDADTLVRNLPRTLPVVLMSSSAAGGSTDSIDIDNFNGAYQLVSHLISHGHSRIAIIRGTERNCDAEERVRGYKAAMKNAKIEGSMMIEERGDFSEASGFDAMKAILERRERPTAVFSSNDSMAIGAL